MIPAARRRTVRADRGGRERLARLAVPRPRVHAGLLLAARVLRRARELLPARVLLTTRERRPALVLLPTRELLRRGLPPQASFAP
ncbi:hypothetical protein V2I01_00355 [Micromonospora sp. BRA006-A]|nr:hypothetical protein [Micromonospora sp. BRA006-A]